MIPIKNEELNNLISSYLNFKAGVVKNVIEIDFLSKLLIENSEFSAINLNGVFAHGSIFRSCTFLNAHLNNMNFNDSSFENCVFHNCSFIKSEFVNASFQNVFFEQSNFTRAELLECKISNCTYVRCDFKFSKLFRSSLVNTKFTDSIELPQKMDNVESNVSW